MTLKCRNRSSLARSNIVLDLLPRQHQRYAQLNPGLHYFRSPRSRHVLWVTCHLIVKHILQMFCLTRQSQLWLRCLRVFPPRSIPELRGPVSGLPGKAEGRAVRQRALVEVGRLQRRRQADHGRTRIRRRIRHSVVRRWLRRSFERHWRSRRHRFVRWGRRSPAGRR